MLHLKYWAFYKDSLSLLQLEKHVTSPLSFEYGYTAWVASHLQRYQL